MQEKIKPYDPETSKKLLESTLQFPDNEDSLIKELTQEIIPKYLNPEFKGDTKTQKMFTEKSMLLMRIQESARHIGLMESFSEQYRMLANNMTRAIITEFKCSNELEKATAELIVNAYIRVLDNSRRLNNELNCENITPNRNIYIANISKQLDRAHRQFTSTAMLLKQMKAPQVEMNIKAHTAFVSNNQQVNIDQDENITPK